MKINLRGIVSYVGTAYLGWQKTKMGPSIEEELEKALTILLKKKPVIQAASRTDAGVHANAQVVNFFIDDPWDLNRLKFRINSLLPKDISLIFLEEAPSSFHPSLDARGKEYHYDVVFGSVQSPFLREFSWHFPYALDIEKMEHAAQDLLGKHDFSSFCNERSLLDIDPVCHLFKIDIEKKSEDRLKILAQGNRFLYRMMRNIVGTLVYVGCGKLPSDGIKQILLAKNRVFAGVTAPPQGLFLHRVDYDFSK